ncbi:MAG TPA: NADH-quinone oxidoreductase subunit NuoH [Thermoflexia bacterium]|jgi:NADH-quinone oxidoreductase subunit H|nr:NADH-quinone oxidoreductase subunit NuoH [Thermoflexia bacterium]
MESLSRFLAFLADAIVNIGDWIRGLLLGAGLVDPWVSLIMKAIGALVVAFFPLMVVVFLIWAYRKVAARMQGRLGPNSSGTWAGPYGILQTFADAIKMLTKEDIRPQGIDLIPYNLAPILVVFASIATWAVMPFGPRLIGSDLNIGIFYILAFSSAALVVFLMAGWSSNNKYATVGAFRSVAQLIGYEIPQLLAVLTVVMVTGSLRMQEIVGQQEIPLLFQLPVTAFIFFLASMAEVNARPFELLEAESELVCGYFIEYSGMKFGMFYLGEFMNSTAVAALFATLFLGGWRGPWVEQAPILGTVWFLLKMGLMLLLWMFIQITFPRLRIDQMLAFNWKFLVPLALANLCVIGLVNKGITEWFPGGVSTWTRAGILLMTNVGIFLATWGILAALERREQRRRETWRAAQVGEVEVSA